MNTLYNEIDAACCAILAEQTRAGVICPGVIEPRSIKELTPDDVRRFTQCHFFAGGGLWSVAARMAGWPDNRPLWTASCPCQPFSQAGKGAGFADERHLWPDLFRLVRAVRPPILVGEQVAGAAGYDWFDRVRTDLEAEGYACRAVDIPACAVDAPHIRQRLYWVSVADASGGGCHGWAEDAQWGALWRDAAQWPAGPLGDAIDARLEGQRRNGDGTARWPLTHRPVAETDGGDRSFWSGADWIACHDGKARRTKPGLRLLVDGLPGRVDLWRVAGNAIVPALAAEVLGALIDTLPPYEDIFA